MHVIAAKAVAFAEAMKPEFFEYQKAVVDNCQVLAEELERYGLKLVSGGTDNHLLLINLIGTGVNGIEVERALGSAGIVVNRNAIPFDPLPPSKASGIRMGTPTVTSRGFTAEEMKLVAKWVARTIENYGNEAILAEIREEVNQLCQKFPVPGIDF